MKTAFLENRWAMFFGILFAILMQPLAPVLKHVYETSAPVVDMHGVVVERTDESVLIHITGRKLRSCEFMRVTAFTANGAGELKDAYLERFSGKAQDGATKPVGMHDLGLWRVWPVAGSARASVFAQHDCNGELILSRIADVDLTRSVK